LTQHVKGRTVPLPTKKSCTKLAERDMVGYIQYYNTKQQTANQAWTNWCCVELAWDVLTF